MAKSTRPIKTITLICLFSTGATCSAMSYTDHLNILQSGEIELDPPGGKIRLYDGSVVEPFGIIHLHSQPERWLRMQDLF